MKQIIILFISLLLNSLSIASSSVYDILDAVAECRENPQEVSNANTVFLKIEEYDQWIFDAGLGPDTKESMMIMGMHACWNSFTQVELKKGSALAVLQQNIRKAPSDPQIIENLLTSSSVIDRWSGLRLANDLEHLSDKTLENIKTIEQSDSYFVVGMRIIPGVNGRPPNPGHVDHRIKAPLSVEAHNLLTKHGVKDSQNKRSLDKEGFIWLCELYLNMPAKRADILLGIQWLTFDDSRCIALQQKLMNGGDTRAIEDILLQLKR